MARAMNIHIKRMATGIPEPKTRDLGVAERQGDAARMAGKPHHDCPYRHPLMRAHWQRGWKAADMREDGL